MAALVPPAFSSRQRFCENCASANVRGPSTPCQVAPTMRFGVDGVVIVAGSMLAPSDGWRRSVSLSMTDACTVCPGATVPVSLPSYRVLSLLEVKGILVCAKALSVVVRSTRAPPKNHTRSRRSGPPTVASNVGEYLLARDTLADCSNGVSALQAGLVRFMRNAPDTSLTPLRVKTLTIASMMGPYLDGMHVERSCTF